MKKVIHLFSQAVCILLLIPISLQAQQQDSLDVKFYTVQDTLIANNVLYLSITNITDDTLLVPWPAKAVDQFGTLLIGNYNNREMNLEIAVSGNSTSYVELPPSDSSRIRFEFNNLSNGIPGDTTHHKFTFETVPSGEYSGTVQNLKRSTGTVGYFSLKVENDSITFDNLIDSLVTPIMRSFINSNVIEYELLFENTERFNEFDSLARSRISLYQSRKLDGRQGVYFQVEYYGSRSVIVNLEVDNLPQKNFEISNVYPNPFNPNTTVNLNIKKSSIYKLNLHDITGRIILSQRLGTLNNGNYSIPLNLKNLKSGTYFLNVRNANQEISNTKKITLIK